jgi:hypothetical protein
MPNSGKWRVVLWRSSICMVLLLLALLLTVPECAYQHVLMQPISIMATAGRKELNMATLLRPRKFWEHDDLNNLIFLSLD